LPEFVIVTIATYPPAPFIVSGCCGDPVMVTTAMLTDSMSGVDVLGAYVAFPEYAAVTMRPPALAKVQVKAPWPFIRGTVTGLLPLIVNVTVPVGTPLWPVTLALKVTGCPTTADVFEGTRLVVAAAKTTSVTVGDVLVKLFASPEYTAVIDGVPMLAKTMV